MEQIAERYRVFATLQAHGSSAVFEDWALGVAQDADILRQLESGTSSDGLYVVARDGEPLALAGTHGQSLTWL